MLFSDLCPIAGYAATEQFEGFKKKLEWGSEHMNWLFIICNSHEVLYA